MSDTLSARRLLPVILVGLGLSTPTWAAPPAPRPSDPVEHTIKPLPLQPIPDDPPPHEGAMIELPYVIEPPDLILIEVLEALPGRPISGERLVRPDGMISLGFYGDVSVKGLTIPQAKEKIIRHLRPYLDDQVLGLKEPGPYEVIPLPGDQEVQEKIPLPEIPPLPGGQDIKEQKEGRRSDQPNNAKSPMRATSSRLRSTGRQSRSPRVRRASQSTEEENRPKPLRAPQAESKEMSLPEALPTATPPFTPTPAPSLVVSPGGNIKITIEVLGNSNSVPPPPPPDANEVPAPDVDLVPVHPVDSVMIFVDVTAYNSKNYYIQGDVAAPGKLPCTGNETVLDAINYAGGLIPTAEPKDIRLIRPARGGKPARIYKVDLEAITQRGESEKNYQIFPGDRLYVGRNPEVKTTLDIDRFAAPMQTIMNSIRQHATMAREIAQMANSAATGGNATMTPEQREAIVKEWADFWWKVANRPQGAALDEEAFRQALMKALNPPAVAKPAGEKE